MDTAKYRYSENLTFLAFWGGDFGQFPRDLIELVGKTAWDTDRKCCHAPNSGFAQWNSIDIY